MASCGVTDRAVVAVDLERDRETREDLFERDRELADADTGRVEDCVCDSGA